MAAGKVGRVLNQSLRYQGGSGGITAQSTGIRGDRDQRQSLARGPASRLTKRHVAEYVSGAPPGRRGVGHVEAGVAPPGGARGRLEERGVQEVRSPQAARRGQDAKGGRHCRAVRVDAVEIDVAEGGAHQGGRHIGPRPQEALQRFAQDAGWGGPSGGS